MTPLPDRLNGLIAGLIAAADSMDAKAEASNVQGIRDLFAELAAERDAAQTARDGWQGIAAQNAAERDRAVAERDEARRMASLMEHKVITCGVAAHHPDANLTRTGAYADKWDSPQAEDVRNLRAERDAERVRGNGIAADLAACVVSRDKALSDRDALQGIIADAESESGLSVLVQDDDHEYPTLPNHIRSIVQERDAEREEKRELALRLGAFILEFGPFEKAKEQRDAAVAVRSELERMLGVLTNGRCGIPKPAQDSKRRVAEGDSESLRKLFAELVEQRDVAVAELAMLKASLGIPPIVNLAEFVKNREVDS